MKNQSSSEKAAVGTRSCSSGAASSTVGMRSRASGVARSTVGMRSRASGVARSMKVGFSVHCSAFAVHLRGYADTPIRQYVATFLHCALLAVTVIFLALTQPAHAADQPATAETRLREMLRTTIMQLRAAETERAALQAAQAESAARKGVDRTG